MTRASDQSKPGQPAIATLPKIFSAAFGCLLGLCLLKFGNPVVMAKFVSQPTNIYEWIFNAWPLTMAPWFLAVVVCAGFAVMRWERKNVPLPLLLLPAAWLVWEFIAGTQTVSPPLTRLTLTHFAACVVCFYLGFFALAPQKNVWPFWLGLLAAFVIVLGFGFQQHFGGLAEMRKYFYLYDFPDPAKPPPPELVKRISTNRIFSTLLYPNTLAQVILLVLPALLAFLWSLQGRFTTGARRFLVAAVAVGGLACLFWSGSKGGWLLMLFEGFIAAMFLPMKRQLKIALVAVFLITGLSGFFIRHAGYFKKGATSVEARFDYWRAALHTTNQKPIFGTGPGTFAIAYEQVKKPESEMARLTHNDYLEQASDSGIPGFLLFTGFIGWCMVHVYRKGGLKSDLIKLAAWLGLLGWALQSLLEFGLYIPAVAWVAFSFMGWLLGSAGNQLDTRQNTN